MIGEDSDSVIASEPFGLMARLWAPQNAILLLYKIPGGARSPYIPCASQGTYLCVVCVSYCVSGLTVQSCTASREVRLSRPSPAPQNRADLLYNIHAGFPV